MILALNSSKNKNFISKYDIGEPKTIWKLCVIDRKALATIFKPGEPPSLLQADECVRFGVLGFENFLDADGNPVKYSTVTRKVYGEIYYILSEELMALIPTNVLYDLGTELMKMCGLV